MSERILFYRLGALGDTLLTLPALDALQPSPGSREKARRLLRGMGLG